VTKAARDLLTEAMDLPEPERLALASELLASVEGPGDPDWDARWLEELDRRVARQGTGESSTSDWADVRARLLARLATP